jgi:apolipoprotein N-acyltransferase
MKLWLKKIKFPSLISLLLAVFSAVFLILAFPDFELWFLAYLALIPLFWAIEREKESLVKSAITGWIFGVTFFTGTCWWLTFAPINYGGVPAPIAYFLLLGATSIVGLFPALFAGLFSVILQRLGVWGIFAAPFLWTAIEFLRFWATGNNWNAIAYSQAFQGGIIKYASIGGIYLVEFWLVWFNTILIFFYLVARLLKSNYSKQNNRLFLLLVFLFPIFTALMPEGKGHYSKLLTRFYSSNNFKGRFVISFIVYFLLWFTWQIVSDFENNKSQPFLYSSANIVIAIQPNVPMSGSKYEEWKRLRDRHLQLAEQEIQKLSTQHSALSTIVIFPESPMNFGYTQDREFQEFLREFTRKNKVQVLFNAAEPSDKKTYYNSAVLVDEKGEKIAQYDKIHLVPFGEYVPFPEPLASLMPTMVGNFELGREYDIIPLGEAKAGIMICFESHFPTLSRQYALQGAEVIVEMTNDGYLGPTPVLRQHLANAVFRAVETNRPLLRVTNVGITAYINERGEILEPSKPYTEDTRVWTVSKSDGSQTFYVKYGDWVGWLCSLVSLGLLLGGFWWRRK